MYEKLISVKIAKTAENIPKETKLGAKKILRIYFIPQWGSSYLLQGSITHIVSADLEFACAF